MNGEQINKLLADTASIKKMVEKDIPYIKKLVEDSKGTLDYLSEQYNQLKTENEMLEVKIEHSEIENKYLQVWRKWKNIRGKIMLF